MYKQAADKTQRMRHADNDQRHKPAVRAMLRQPKGSTRRVLHTIRNEPTPCHEYASKCLCRANDFGTNFALIREWRAQTGAYHKFATCSSTALTGVCQHYGGGKARAVCASEWKCFGKL